MGSSKLSNIGIERGMIRLFAPNMQIHEASPNKFLSLSLSLRLLDDHLKIRIKTISIKYDSNELITRLFYIQERQVPLN
jgi:hypothetical protein